MEKDFFEKSSQTFLVVILNEIPYLFLVPKLKPIKIDGVECFAFPLSDPDVEIALTTDQRIFGLSVLSEEKKLLKFNGKATPSKDEEILKIFGGDKVSDFVVLVKIESSKEESMK